MPSPPRQTPKRERVSDMIAAQIQQSIADGEIGPGERLPAERELAQRFNTSRLSIREAYRSLQELGLIAIRRGAGGGAFITEIDHGPMSKSLTMMLHLGRTTNEELTEARLLLEPPVARLAARRSSPEDIERLQDLVNRQADALKSNEGPRRLALDFHRLVARCARNLPLEITMNALADVAREAITKIDLSEGAVHEHVVTFHQKIVNAIKKHDEDLAYDLMERHVADVQGRLGKNLLRQIRDRRAVAAKKERAREKAIGVRAARP